MKQIALIASVAGSLAFAASADAADSEDKKGFFSSLSSDKGGESLPAGGVLWHGHIVSDKTSGIACGFEKNQMALRVADGEFVGKANDVSDNTRTIKGKVGGDGGIDSWTDWAIIGGGTRDLKTRKARITGNFTDGRFNGRLSAGHTPLWGDDAIHSDGYPVCDASIVLKRQIPDGFDGDWTGTLLAKPDGFDGDWTGTLLAKNDIQNLGSCGFEEQPFVIRVSKDEFIAKG